MGLVCASHTEAVCACPSVSMAVRKKKKCLPLGRSGQLRAGSRIGSRMLKKNGRGSCYARSVLLGAAKHVHALSPFFIRYFIASRTPVLQPLCSMRRILPCSYPVFMALQYLFSLSRLSLCSIYERRPFDTDTCLDASQTRDDGILERNV